MSAKFSCLLSLVLLVSFSGCVQKTKVSQEQIVQEIKLLQKQKATKILMTIVYKDGKKVSVELEPALFVECLEQAGCFGNTDCCCEYPN